MRIHSTLGSKDFRQARAQYYKLYRVVTTKTRCEGATMGWELKYASLDMLTPNRLSRTSPPLGLHLAAGAILILLHSTLASFPLKINNYQLRKHNSNIPAGLLSTIRRPLGNIPGVHHFYSATQSSTIASLPVSVTCLQPDARCSPHQYDCVGSGYDRSDAGHETLTSHSYRTTRPLPSVPRGAFAGARRPRS